MDNFHICNYLKLDFDFPTLLHGTNMQDLQKEDSMTSLMVHIFQRIKKMMTLVTIDN